MTQKVGQKFEKDFKDSVSGDMLCVRLKTRMTVYKGDNEIADYLVYRHPSIFVFELKTTKEKRLPFDMIRSNQILGIQKAVKHFGVYGGILVQFREPTYSHFYVPIEVLVEYIERGSKSIPISDMHTHPKIIQVEFTQKRVTCKLNVDGLLKAIEEGK